MSKEKKTGSVFVKDEYFHDMITYNRRQYWVDEVHNIEKIKGKWCVNVEVPGVNHDPRIFTISVRGYDNEPDNDTLNIKRPALFYNIDDARKFCDELRFLKSSLRATLVNDALANHKIFKEIGAYLIKISNIVVPKKNLILGRPPQEELDEMKSAYGDTKGIFLV